MRAALEEEEERQLELQNGITELMEELLESEQGGVKDSKGMHSMEKGDNEVILPSHNHRISSTPSATVIELVDDGLEASNRNEQNGRPSQHIDAKSKETKESTLSMPSGEHELKKESFVEHPSGGMEIDAANELKPERPQVSIIEAQPSLAGQEKAIHTPNYPQNNADQRTSTSIILDEPAQQLDSVTILSKQLATSKPLSKKPPTIQQPPTQQSAAALRSSVMSRKPPTSAIQYESTNQFDDEILPAHVVPVPVADISFDVVGYKPARDECLANYVVVLTSVRACCVDDLYQHAEMYELLRPSWPVLIKAGLVHENEQTLLEWPLLRVKVGSETSPRQN